MVLRPRSGGLYLRSRVLSRSVCGGFEVGVNGVRLGLVIRRGMTVVPLRTACWMRRNPRSLQLLMARWRSVVAAVRALVVPIGPVAECMVYKLCQHIIQIRHICSTSECVDLLFPRIITCRTLGPTFPPVAVLSHWGWTASPILLQSHHTIHIGI